MAVRVRSISRKLGGLNMETSIVYNYHLIGYFILFVELVSSVPRPSPKKKKVQCPAAHWRKDHTTQRSQRQQLYTSVTYHEWRLKLSLHHASSCSPVAPSSRQAPMSHPLHSASKIFDGVMPYVWSLPTDTNKGSVLGSRRKWRHYPMKNQPLFLDADKGTRRTVKGHQPNKTLSPNIKFNKAMPIHKVTPSRLFITELSSYVPGDQALKILDPRPASRTLATVFIWRKQRKKKDNRLQNLGILWCYDAIC